MTDTTRLTIEETERCIVEIEAGGVSRDLALTGFRQLLAVMQENERLGEVARYAKQCTDVPPNAGNDYRPKWEVELNRLATLALSNEV